jgi:hypothetical protein
MSTIYVLGFGPGVPIRTGSFQPLPCIYVWRQPIFRPALPHSCIHSTIWLSPSPRSRSPDTRVYGPRSVAFPGSTLRGHAAENLALCVTFVTSGALGSTNYLAGLAFFVAFLPNVSSGLHWFPLDPRRLHMVSLLGLPQLISILHLHFLYRGSVFRLPDSISYLLIMA